MFTARYDGLVNGDTGADIAHLDFDAVPAGNDVGTYPIVPRQGANPNYDIDYVLGTETITRAPLTIKATDTTAKYGVLGTYPWKGVGWVNGDDDAGIGTPPTCVATVQGAAASVHTAPGTYLDAIGCSGAHDPNYAIGYAAGTLTVNPVINLAQTGLPSTVARRAFIDHQPVTLPTGDVEVAYGTGHDYSFPRVVVGGKGGAYLTRTPGFTGPVASNLSKTARYLTMAKVLAAEAAGDGVDRMAARSLGTSWTTVRVRLEKGQADRARKAVQRFADDVRDLKGKHVERHSARLLIAYAQTVFVFVDGKGPV
jgi:hypothetical protein